MKKVDSMHQKMAKSRLEKETIGKELVEIHTWKIVTEMKNSFGGLVHKLKTVKEKTCEF